MVPYGIRTKPECPSLLYRTGSCVDLEEEGAVRYVLWYVLRQKSCLSYILRQNSCMECIH